MATRNIVPRLNEEGNIGTSLKRWLKGWFKDLFVSGVITDGTYNFAIQDVAQASTFGTQRQYAESEAEASTTAQTFQQKLRLTTGSLPAGNYRIGYSWMQSMSATTKGFFGRVRVDATTDIYAGNERVALANDYTLRGGFKQMSLGAGVHTIDIEYYSEGSTVTAYIKMARIEIWRVS